MATVRIGNLTVIGESISIDGTVIAIDGEVITEAQAAKARAAISPISVSVIDGVLRNISATGEVVLTGPVNGRVQLSAKG